jgi:hypothetical protein
LAPERNRARIWTVAGVLLWKVAQSVVVDELRDWIVNVG